MTKIGEWVWWYDEFKDRHIAQVIGFEPDHRLRVFVYPENSGQGKTVFRYPDEIDYPNQEEITDMPKDAYTEGLELGKAMREVFGGTADYSTNPQAVFALGRKFATMTGYAALDDGFKFIEGFVVAFQQSKPKQITEAVDENNG